MSDALATRTSTSPTPPCPICSALIELYESVNFDGDEHSLDPRKTTSAEFAAWCLRVWCIVMLVGTAILRGIVVPAWLLSRTRYTFWVAARPVMLGGGRRVGIREPLAADC